uniref:Ig-like domain-containing protein n=1 Tax=Acrobeloides nanus TaxID=290746 RepID=A0A914E346_9BILA
MLTQLYVFLLLAVIGINGWQPKLYSKENFVMRVRQDSYVTCHVVLEKDEGNDILPAITWYKDGIEVLPLKTTSRGLTKKDILSKTLYLKNPTYQDNGNYSCEVTVGNQTKMAAVGLNFKDGAKFVNTPIEQYVVNGTEARIQCNVVGDDVAVEWLKNGTVIKENGKYSTENEGRILVIKMYYAHDSGVYQCRWNQDDKNETLDILVTTYEKPAIIQFDLVKTAIEGQDFEMKCIANGKPAPSVRWYKMTDDKVGIQSDYYNNTKNGSLTLHNVRASDAGWYLCEAENLLFDKDSRMIRIDVMGKPKIDPIEKEVAKRGENVTLQCQFHGDGRLHVRWIRNDEVIVQKVFSASNKTQSLNLTLTDVGYADRGFYRCEVSNDAGTVANSTILYVNVPPTIINEAHRNLSVLPLTNVTLSCDADAYPVPIWNWYFSNETTTKLDLKNSTYTKITVTENGGSKLKIKEFLPAHLGNYICEARNANGNDSAVISVVKKFPPAIPLLECDVGNTKDSLYCVDNNSLNNMTEDSPRSYIVYYVEEKTNDASADCCSNGTTLKNCLADRQTVTNNASHLWIYDMKPTTKYILQVVAENEAGESEVSECIWVATAASTSSSPVPIILYIIIAILALILLIDLFCCLAHGKGMFAALYRRVCRRSNDQILPRDDVESPSEQNSFIEEQEVVYESNVMRTGSNSAFNSSKF